MTSNTAHAKLARALLVCIVFASVAAPADATAFLGRYDGGAERQQLGKDAEQQLLTALEAELGSEHRAFTERRLDRIKHTLEPIFKAMPKNKYGKLERATVSYTMRRLFLERHAWFVKGLEPVSSQFAEWKETCPMKIFDQQIAISITGDMRARINATGLGLHEIAVMAATYEHLVHKEALLRLKAAYQAERLDIEQEVSAEEVRVVVDTYMSIYILGILAGNVHELTPDWVQMLRQNVTHLYPSFPDTQAFVREVQENVLPSRDFFHFSEVVNVVEEIGERYGRWQNAECMTLKDALVQREDKNAGGDGRVPLTDFYKAALFDGKWEFAESVSYLRVLGALDESDPKNMKVIIPNYVNAPSNCVASTSFYSVCCIDECQGLLAHLESVIQSPEAPPSQILEVISQLPSSTVQGNRTLPAWLLHRLDQVAEHHEGFVPLYGRLFAQWMHYTYPRECSYPHALGKTKKIRGDAFFFEYNLDFSATEDEMRETIETQHHNLPHLDDTDAHADEEHLLRMQSAMWTMEEELIVPRISDDVVGTSTLLRGFVLICALSTFAIDLVRRSRPLRSMKGGPSSEKYYV